MCPFCYLGKKQIERAIETFEHRDAVVVAYHAFELHPNAPASYGLTLDELVARKYSVDVVQAHTMHERLEADAARLDMRWRLEIARPGNTFDAHRLIAYAATQALAPDVVDRLFRAYFCEGQLVSDRETLHSVAREAGLQGADEILDSDAFADEVRADEADAAELGFAGVPAFLVDRRFVVSGAQPVEVMANVLDRAWARRVAS